MAIRPHVSVIIPAYNGEDYLRQCLDSVFAQTLKGLQVICVNDGSTDCTAQILDEYQVKHPDMVIVTQENGGLSAARNAGMALASGEYIDFLDCDDMLKTNALEQLYERARQDQLDMLFFDGETVYASEELRRALPNYEKLYQTKIQLEKRIIPGEELFVKLVDGKSYRASACMYLLRTDFVKSQGITFIPGIYYEDNVFTLQCLLTAQRAGVEAVPYYLRSLRDGSIVTVRKNYRHVRSYYICQIAIQNFIFEHCFSADTIRCAQTQINSLLSNALLVYAELSEKEKKEALEQYPETRVIEGALHTRRITGKSTADKTRINDTQPKETPAWLQENYWKQYTVGKYVQDSPLISVIIPVYNAEAFLKETLYDLQNQTLRNFEMIFVDDGSTDESCALLEACAKEDPRIRIICQNNQFAGVARNNGMAKARGEYMLFLDSDDRFDHNLLAYTYACAKYTNAEVVIFHADLLQMPQEIFVPANYLCPCNRLPEQVFSGMEGKEHIFDVLNPWTKLYSRAYIQRLEIQYQPLYSSNDLFFSMVALACAEHIAPLPEILVHYRVGQVGNIQSNKTKAPLDTYHAFEAVKQELTARGLYEVYRKPFAVKAAESMLRTLDTMKSIEGYQKLYQVLHDGGLAYFDVDCVSEKDMQHISEGAYKLKRCYEIMEMEYDEYCLKALGELKTSRNMPAVSTCDVQEIERLTAEVRALRGSYAFRIGCQLTKPFHYLKQLYGKFREA